MKRVSLFGYSKMVKIDNAFVYLPLLQGLPQTFTRDVQEFVKILYSSGQTDLSAKQQLDHSENNVFNIYKLIILSNAAFVDLLVWSSDELAGVSLCNALTEKINSSPGHKLAISHYPLLVVCLDGLGELAQKFPNIADDIVASLRDFLVNPSPILFKLDKQQTEMQNRSNTFNITPPYEDIARDLQSSINFNSCCCFSVRFRISFNCSGVNEDGRPFRSYQYLSPLFMFENCRATIHANVGPISAPGKGTSDTPALHKSISSGCLLKVIN